MKIRTDFVTNSSSSSYTVNLRITLTDGNVFDVESYADEEAGPCFNADIDLKKLGKAENLSELLDLLESEALESLSGGNHAEEYEDEEYADEDEEYDEDEELFYEDEGAFYDSEGLKAKMTSWKEDVLSAAHDINEINTVSVTSGETLGGEFVEPIIDELMDAVDINMFSNGPDEERIDQLSDEEIESRLRDSYWAKNKKESHIAKALGILRNQKYEMLSRGIRKTLTLKNKEIVEDGFFLDESIPDSNDTLQRLIDGDGSD